MGSGENSLSLLGLSLAHTAPSGVTAGVSPVTCHVSVTHEIGCLSNFFYLDEKEGTASRSS